MMKVNWRPVAATQPPIGELVLIAYRFMEDDELTVDMAELDRDGQWIYLGGGPIQHGTVLFWHPAPPAPALPAELAQEQAVAA